MTPQISLVERAGAVCFGLVIGYLTYRTLIRTKDKPKISDLAAVLAAIGGGAVTSLFDPSTELFAFYSIGLLIGMVVYFIGYGVLNGKTALAAVMSRDANPTADGDRTGG